jgi:hypothetical protein
MGANLEVLALEIGARLSNMILIKGHRIRRRSKSGGLPCAVQVVVIVAIWRWILIVATIPLPMVVAKVPPRILITINS